MNILHTECSMNWGGQEFRTLLEHNYLNNHGMNSWIMCHPKSAFFKKAELLKCKNIIAMDFSKTWNIVVAIHVLVFCIKNKIDIINSHGARDSTLCLLAFFYGIPLIRSRQITSTIRKNFSFKYGCSHVIASAQIIKDMLIINGVEDNKITVVGEGVCLNEYNENNNSKYLKSEFGIKDSDIVVINIGMIRADKGQEYYIKSAQNIVKQHNNIKFFLIGEGTEDKQLEIKLHQQVKDSDIENNFFMTGYRTDIAAFIHLSDFVVISSLEEAQSRIVPQAFASRRTVVSTHVGGLTELVENEVNGLLVSPKNVTEMTTAMLRLIKDENLRNTLADNAYQMANNHLSFEKMMNKIIDIYIRFIGHC